MDDDPGARRAVDRCDVVNIMPRRSHAERFPEVPNPGGCLIEIRQEEPGEPFTIWMHETSGEVGGSEPLVSWPAVLDRLSDLLAMLVRAKCPSVGIMFYSAEPRRKAVQHEDVLALVRRHYPEPIIPGVLGDGDIGGHAGGRYGHRGSRAYPALIGAPAP